MHIVKKLFWGFLFFHFTLLAQAKCVVSSPRITASEIDKRIDQLKIQLGKESKYKKRLSLIEKELGFYLCEARKTADLKADDKTAIRVFEIKSILSDLSQTPCQELESKIKLDDMDIGSGEETYTPSKSAKEALDLSKLLCQN